MKYGIFVAIIMLVEYLHKDCVCVCVCFPDLISSMDRVGWIQEVCCKSYCLTLRVGWLFSVRVFVLSRSTLKSQDSDFLSAKPKRNLG